MMPSEPAVATVVDDTPHAAPGIATLDMGVLYGTTREHQYLELALTAGPLDEADWHRAASADPQPAAPRRAPAIPAQRRPPSDATRA